jgi:hypothetical protein
MRRYDETIDKEHFRDLRAIDDALRKSAEEIGGQDPTKADLAAKLWNRLILELQSGPDGVTKARSCLENALRLTFPYTETYHFCRSLYQISLTDEFPTTSEPMALLTEAMKRNTDALTSKSSPQRHHCE